MAYQLLEKGKFGSSVCSEPFITVTKDSFFINKAAREAFDIGLYKYVDCFADDEEPKLALQLLKEPGLHSRRLSSGDGSLNIGAQGYIKRLGIAPGRYPLSYNEEEGMLEFVYQRAGSEPAEDAAETEADEQPTRRRGRPRKAA